MPDSWLFAKGDASVRILRTGSLTFAVCGPGRQREVHSFAEQTHLVEFLKETEHELTAGGFRLAGYAADRRSGLDRRASGRGQDRRGTAPW